MGETLSVGEVAARSGVAVSALHFGVPLASVREALATLPDGRAPTAAEWRRLSAKWRAELDDRIARLKQLRDHLDQCIGCGCLSIDNCWLPA